MLDLMDPHISTVVQVLQVPEDEAWIYLLVINPEETRKASTTHVPSEEIKKPLGNKERAPRRAVTSSPCCLNQNVIRLKKAAMRRPLREVSKRNARHVPETR
ncbi:hypothetical protein GCM10018772_10300 [Streptomyces fumanus]|uniref:Uncharacterized protein n=1 Tax=Streptomyces fumanus TaxID=67302 RepID=A0A919A5T4_9ACTN|nr:hypothetical protein GCM10018772_10300 [Streptomyces fumanus]